MTPDRFLAAHPDVARVQFVVVDPNGRARGKWAPVAALEKAFGAGVNFPLSIHGLDVWGSEVPETGLHISSGDRDGFFRAVPHTLCRLPNGDAQVLLETFDAVGRPFAGCVRQVLKRVVETLPFTATMAFELEFHLLDLHGAHPAGEGALRGRQLMYDLAALERRRAFANAVTQAAAAADLPVDTVVKEAGPAQFEINLHHRADPLRASDDAVLLRRVVESAATREGLRATFMAKPDPDAPGNGMHLHCSLADDRGPVLARDGEGWQRLRHAAAGLVATMPEGALAFANGVNGHRRLAPGTYAPTHATWGTNNRSVAVRVPTGAPRLEHRVAGADANPFLVAALVLAGMAHGLTERLEPPPQVEGNAYEAEAGAPLPATLGEAIDAWADSDFCRETLGATLHANLAHLKRAELAGFAADISPLERATYL